MYNKICIFTLVFSLWASGSALALPSNPWSPNDGYMGKDVADTNLEKAPVYKSNRGDGEILPVDPWARARDRSGIKTWRGSGQHGKLNYIGEATTYGTAQGQEMIAPEVNRHNMITATQYLRKLGYKIPDSYDSKIKSMPQDYAIKLRKAYNEISIADPNNDPLSGMFNKMLQGVELGTGLDMENILFNSIDLLSTD